MKWTDKRVKQLEDMRRLCVEAAALNHGSHVTDRILLCEKLANSLYQTDLDAKEDIESFHQFLMGLAISERRA